MADALIAKYPFYTKLVIQGNLHRNRRRYKAVAVQAMLAIDAGMDEDLAYNLLKTMYDNHDRMVAAHTTAEPRLPETGLDGMVSSCTQALQDTSTNKLKGNIV